MMILRRRCQEVVAKTKICFVELLKAKAYGIQNGEYISVLYKVKSNSKYLLCVFKFNAMISDVN